MPSGGARTRSGPPPDPTALRRDRKSDGEWTVLPTEGRSGAAPAWPLTEHDEPAAAAREASLWERLWSTPQAAQWEKLGQDLEVALYVRRLAEAEQPGATANLATLVRQMADALGLTIPGLRTNRWKIAADQVTAKREEKESAFGTARRGARNRFQVIDGQAV